MNLPDSVVYPLDANHAGIRLAVLASLVLGGLIGFAAFEILANLVGLSPPFWASLLSALLGAFALAFALERWLPGVWPSGRRLVVTDTQLQLIERSGAQIVLTLTEPIQQNHWYFVIPHQRGSVKKGWYCAACHLKQDAGAISLYTFIDPQIAGQFSEWSAFERLQPRKQADPTKKGAEIVDDQADLRVLEQLRWAHGAEMRPADFAAVMSLLVQPQMSSAAPNS